MWDHPTTKAMSKTVRHLEQQRNQAVIDDPQRNTAADTMTPEEFRLCINTLDRKGPVDAAAVRYNAIMKAARGALFRGSDVRKLRISDLFLMRMPLKYASPDRVNILCMLSREGKTNQHHRPEYGVLFRGRDAEWCAQSALALWLWVRFHVLNEPAPDFTQKEWMRRLVFPADIPTRLHEGMDAGNQSKYIGNLFEECNVKTGKVMHAFRPSGAMQAA